MNLYLNSFGSSLKVENGMFRVDNGEETQKLSVEQVKSICINRSAIMSAASMFLAIENGIPVLLLTRSGAVKGRIWSASYGSISTIRKNQLAFTESEQAKRWIISLIDQKLLNQQQLLWIFEGNTKQEQEAIEKTQHRIASSRSHLKKLERLPFEELKKKIIGVEGSAGRIYFGLVSANLPEAYRFRGRSRRPAKDMFNALLNYAYGMLYSIIEGAIITAGLDPYIGVLHRDDYNKPVLVYDIIERYRIWADAVVIRLCRQRVIFEEFFTIEQDAWFLNEFGRKILISSLGDYLQEMVVLEGSQYSRKNHITNYCRSLAKHLSTNTMDDLCYT
jgi:CRISPR-associated protein Cas1